MIPKRSAAHDYNAIMRVHTLTCGCFCPMGARLFHGRGSLLARACILCRCLLVESRAGLVLIDTGLGLAEYRKFAKLSQLPARLIFAPKMDESLLAVHQIRQLGFDPRDVRHIVCTHLDYDHAGGLPDFPEALIHVSASEHHAAGCRACTIDKVRYHPHQIAHQPRWVRHPHKGETWMGFGQVRSIAGLEDELLLVPLQGHSAGHCGVAVRTQDHWLLHAGDAIIHHGELQAPERCPLFHRVFRRMVAHDRPMLAANRQRLRELGAKGQVRITNSHDVDLPA